MLSLLRCAHADTCRLNSKQVQLAAGNDMNSCTRLLHLSSTGCRKLAFGIIVVYVIITCYVVYSGLLQLSVWYRIARQPPLTLSSLGHVTRTTIAIGGGITSKRLQGVTETNVAKKFVFLTSLVPSFCQTASPQFSYSFYLAYNSADGVFSNDRLSAAFLAAFQHQIRNLCPGSISPTLRLINCSYRGNPAWAQNDAMMDAYLDNVDYFYRINDDTKMLTSHWAEMFVAALDGFDPPRVGVVGPTHTGGNVGILTYDFVHRTHVDIFGFYYPRVFTDWFGDGWITRVYRPNRCVKLSRVRVVHTLGLGKRYRVNHSRKRLLQPAVQRGKLILDRYEYRTVHAVSLEYSLVIRHKHHVSLLELLYHHDESSTWTTSVITLNFPPDLLLSLTVISYL